MASRGEERGVVSTFDRRGRGEGVNMLSSRSSASTGSWCKIRRVDVKEDAELWEMESERYRLVVPSNLSSLVTSVGRREVTTSSVPALISSAANSNNTLAAMGKLPGGNHVKHSMRMALTLRRIRASLPSSFTRPKGPVEDKTPNNFSKSSVVRFSASGILSSHSGQYFKKDTNENNMLSKHNSLLMRSNCSNEVTLLCQS
mmetsp:Transcript_14640/g.18437  ORF Transcript_14640/g.18437 Transcript_14640/m.18437 type:complete len:201 (+) Transcript_14640:1374-1976(+)